MAKQNHSRSKSKNAEKIGKGKVTPVQVAFIVDRYLLDNNFNKTRTIFRSEAANLLSKSPVQEAPKSLLSLGAMLDEYISLKELKVSLEQERYRMEQDKLRVDNLLKGLQDAMNGFNATAHLVTPQPLIHPPPAPPPPPHSVNSGITASPGYYSVYGSPAMISTFKPSYSGVDTTSAPSQTTNSIALKRKPSANPLDATHIARKSRKSSTSTNQLLSKGATAHSQPTKGDNQVILISEGNSADQSLVHHSQVSNGSNPVQTSNVVKCLFTKPDKSSPHNSSDPKTPPLQSSSDAERTASPVAMCSTAGSSKDVTPQQITSTNCTIISSETIRVSPEKQISYYSIARNQQITASPAKANLKKPNRRDHVKGRLDFDAPEMLKSSETPASNEISASGCAKEVDDILDLEDFPNLDMLGSLNLSELLSDFDLADEGTSCSSQPSGDSSPDSSSWSPQQSLEVCRGANQVYSQLSSTVTEIISEKDMTSSGSDPVTTVKSITKTIKILSPDTKGTRWFDTNI
ncbi:OLC1v1034998C1 [Oldenlandia corymbosa var. corymbosa]|uniref:OLC1v1034998C1 n=1 Tax=Oldenlandia corymbosa var. corymbosa TaxID=529605 RepID=A0AAV1CS20_OLDCO|nr:OLC1v1034998C1 [Oldenlandia corymbosa var. corymbosa]